MFLVKCIVSEIEANLGHDMKSLQYKVNLVIFLKDITDPIVIKKPVMAD